MWSLFSLIAELFAGYQGYREERRSGSWSWTKFFAVCAFIMLEGGLVLAPMLLPFASRFFLPAFLMCGLIALANFAWFIPLMRRWKQSV